MTDTEGDITELKQVEGGNADQIYPPNVTLPRDASARSNLKVTDGCPSSQENTTITKSGPEQTY